MNDRIKELANLAGWKYILGGNPRTRIEDRDYIVTKEQAEKFAELIVEECISVCKESNYEFNTIFTKMIKKHFGV